MGKHVIVVHVIAAGCHGRSRRRTADIVMVAGVCGPQSRYLVWSGLLVSECLASPEGRPPVDWSGARVGASGTHRGLFSELGLVMCPILCGAARYLSPRLLASAAETRTRAAHWAGGHCPLRAAGRRRPLD